jgi:hypothetical protein
MFIRTVLFTTLVLMCGGVVMAQRPGPQFWRKVGCEPFEPRTKLEALENSTGLVIKGFTRITTVEAPARIDAVEMRDLRSVNNIRVVKGIVITVRADTPDAKWAFVDYDEVDNLLNAIDVIGRVDETATKMPGFEARYRTFGDLEISVFRQTRSGTAVIMRAGICEQATQSMSLDDLGKIKAMIQEAKTRLDEIK